MKREELKIWFWNLYNSCYPILKDNMIYMVYDINFIRAKKLANILNKDVEYPTEIKGEILFQIDQFYFSISEKIWKRTFTYFNNYIITQNFIRENMNEYDILNGLIPSNINNLKFHNYKKTLIHIIEDNQI